MTRLGAFAALIILGGCNCDPRGVFPDAGSSEVDAGEETDAGGEEPADAGRVSVDAGPLPVDAGAELDADAGEEPVDAGPVPVDAGSFTLTRLTFSDSASSGTPDTYFIDVVPGTPLHAEITGGGNGTWVVNVNNGTSQGIYCSDSPICDTVIPAGETAVLVTAVTTDIGFYNLIVDAVVP